LTTTAIEQGAARAAANAVAVDLLGAFGVRWDGVSFQLPFAAQRVVALLAIQGRPLPRAHVAGVLWMDSSEERAAASLRSALWRIGLPGCSVVRANNQVLALAPGVSVDLHEAVARAHRLLGWPPGDSAADDSDPNEEHRTWLALSAELLPGWYDDWVIVERERFNQLRLHALEALSRSLTAAGRFGPAVEAGHAAIAIEPLRESAHRVLISAHLAEGNRADALHQYEIYRRLCVHELGCEPSAQMTSLLTIAGPLTRR
jgi:DNA-binding SARP family transcriptional activator